MANRKGLLTTLDSLYTSYFTLSALETQLADRLSEYTGQHKALTLEQQKSHKSHLREAPFFFSSNATGLSVSLLRA